MQSDHAYQLPVSNIAYHVYSPDEDIARTKAVSRRAFKRTMDNYQEYEHLADLFQVELDKREQLTRERKERERSLKAQKKSLKRSQQGRSQDTSQSSLPERHSLRRHLRNSSANASNNSFAEGNRDPAAGEKSSGGLKRSRRNSDISTSDISGYGDDDVRLLPPLPSSIHHTNSTSSRHRGLGIHPNERSLSSSPALPLTPSPRLTPSDSRNENRTVESGIGPSHQSMNQSTADSSSTSSGTTPAHTEALALPGHMMVGRRKRKQAIPVHPSVVDRIPGITLRIQREKLGDQLQVEILKNLDDYRARLEKDLSPASKLQATQDLRKVKDSIESGRPGYAFFPAPSSISLLHRLEDSPETNRSTSNSGMSSTQDWNRDVNANSRNALLWHQSASSSLASLTCASSNTGSVDPLAVMTDLFDARSLPLSWENFSTRECVVNKVVGKHDKDLDILEEVVQDAIIRQHHTNHQNVQQQQQSQAHQEKDSDNSVVSSIHSQRRPSGASTGSLAGPTSVVVIPGSVSVPVAAVPVNNRLLKSTGTSSPPIARSTPIRATRSRKQISDQSGDIVGGDSDLVAHDDIELILKQRRRRKLEERKRQGSKASSRDGEEEEGDDGDGGDRDESEASLKIEICEEPKDMDALQDSYTNRDHDLNKPNEAYSDGDREDGDGDVPMTKSNKPQRKRRGSSMESDVPTTPRRTTEAPSMVTTRTRGGPVRARRQLDDYVYEGLTSSSDSDSGSEDDDEYRDKSYRGSGGSRRRSVVMEPKVVTDSEPKKALERKKTPEPAKPLEPKKPPGLKVDVTQSTNIVASHASKSHGSQEKRPSLVQSQQSPRYRLPISVPIVSAEGHRRTKKLWSRGRNSRKEDEVVDTTSDDDSIEEDAEGDRKMPLAKHVEPRPAAPITSVEMPAIVPSSSTYHTPSTQNRRISMSGSSHISASASDSATGVPLPAQSIANDNGGTTNGGSKRNYSTRESGGRTRARARSFSNTINTDDKTKFFENAQGLIDQKRRETLAKKRAAREAEERERQELEQREQQEKEEKVERERLETLVQLQQQEKAPKIEASNLPKSSKSLPGRVLRRTKADGSAVEGSVDPDCTSCRLELSTEDKSLWKAAQESGEIQLPKTWGSHAILCTACRLQYLDHHWRCTACFYVPAKEEMITSSCSRCKAGTWLREAVRLPPGATLLVERRDSRRKNVSDISV
ncbi:hypothetical protein BGX26_012572 [Mortierella sp. AD094]|nr:hypothetical protein BGX26_012572 [Mortierella sp. AD094]